MEWLTRHFIFRVCGLVGECNGDDDDEKNAQLSKLKLCVVLYVLLNMGEWMEDVGDYMEWRGLVINDDLFVSLAHCTTHTIQYSEKPSIQQHWLTTT